MLIGWLSSTTIVSAISATPWEVCLDVLLSAIEEWIVLNILVKSSVPAINTPLFATVPNVVWASEPDVISNPIA